MSTFVPRTCRCPACGHAEERRIAVSLSGVLRPDVVEEITHDRFQDFACEGCGQRYVVDDPLIYIDFARKHWVACLPARGEVGWHRYEQESWHAWELNMLRNAPPMVRQQAGGFTIRTVFGLAALRDKLVALRAGLDDRWLEVLKLALMREQGVLSIAHRPRLRVVEADRLRLTVRSRAMELIVPRSRYEALLLSPLGWISALEAVSRGPYVDVGRLLIGGEEAVEGAAFP